MDGVAGCSLPKKGKNPPLLRILEGQFASVTQSAALAERASFCRRFMAPHLLRRRIGTAGLRPLNQPNTRLF